MEFLQNDPAGSTTGTGAGSPVGAPEKRRPGAGLLLLLAPLLCCGGPLIIALLATASAATLGTVGAVLGGVVLAAVALTIWARHRRGVSAACCPPKRAYRS
jgi:hypothetical protein